MLEETSPEGQRKVKSLAKGVKQAVLMNKIKFDVRDGIMKALISSKEERLVGEHAADDSPEVLSVKRQKENLKNHRENVFNRTLNEETKQLSGIAN